MASDMESSDWGEALGIPKNPSETGDGWGRQPKPAGGPRDKLWGSPHQGQKQPCIYFTQQLANTEGLDACLNECIEPCGHMAATMRGSLLLPGVHSWESGRVMWIQLWGTGKPGFGPQAGGQVGRGPACRL